MEVDLERSCNRSSGFLQLKFNSLELDSEIRRVVSMLNISKHKTQRL